MAHYVPPVQSKFGQIIDVIVLLVLAIGSLFVPLKLGLSGKLPGLTDSTREARISASPHCGMTAGGV